MSQNVTTPTAVPAPFAASEIAELLRDLDFAEVEVSTKRRIVGADLDDSGMRDFTATLSLYVSVMSLPEEDVPTWYGRDSWRDVTWEEKVGLLAKVSPILAVLANDISPECEGVVVELVTVAGSILRPERLGGSLFDALDSRSQAHYELLPALTENSIWGGPGLKPSLDNQMESVGDIVLLTDVVSSRRWEEVSPGLESGLLSQVLQDVSAGACAVLTKVGTLASKTQVEKARKVYIESFWKGASFKKWRNGIWYASTALQAFEDPALRVGHLVG